MSRSLSQTLTRITHTSTTTVAISAAARRNQSTQPETGVAKTKEEVERAALKKLEDAIHRMIIKKSEPDWLPLVPGGSYWVPPKSQSRGFAQVVANLRQAEIKRAEIKLKRTGLIGASNSPLEEEMNSKNSNQSEEDEE
ncbi:hypothetical protein KSS87_006868 [Heliosperma pusillum]|nr:hypothetical protein KSS87_006868 [Heliosperma pusillum]